MTTPKLDAKVLRGRLNAAFIEALSREWEVHGDEVLARIWDKNPEKFAELVARLQPQQNEVEINNPHDYSEAQSEIEVADRVIANRNPEVIITDALRDIVINVHRRAVDEINAAIDAAAEKPVRRNKVDEVQIIAATAFKL